MVGLLCRFYAVTPPATVFGRRSCCSVPTTHFSRPAMALAGIAIEASVVARKVVMPGSYRRSTRASTTFLWAREKLP